MLLPTSRSRVSTEPAGGMYGSVWHTPIWARVGLSASGGPECLGWLCTLSPPTVCVQRSVDGVLVGFNTSGSMAMRKKTYSREWWTTTTCAIPFPWLQHITCVLSAPKLIVNENVECVMLMRNGVSLQVNQIA